MTSDADIRAWARESGVDVPARGKVPEGVRAAWSDAHPAGDNPELSPAGQAPEHGYADAGPVPTRPETAAQGHPDEVAPTAPPGRFNALRRPGKTAAVARKEHRRVSLESVAAGAWTMLGQMAQSRGLVPTGRALVMQAPVAGMVLEDALKGTVLDRIVQPLARGGEAAKELGALFGVPILVTMVTLKPETQDTAVPILRNLMREWAILAGPRIKARERREKKAMEQLGVDESGLDALVDGWLEAMFAPPPGMAPEAADGA